LRCHASPHLVSYILDGTGLQPYQGMSAKAVLIDWWGLFDSAHLRIVGGTQRLATTLAASLKNRVRYEAKVVEVSLSERGVAIGWRGHGTEIEERDTFDHAVVAIPARAAKEIRFTPMLPPEKYEALCNLTYISSHKTLLHM